jgi:transposase-like protein
MSVLENKVTIRQRKEKFSIEERRGYCMAWKQSNLNLIEYCKANGISRSAFQRWRKEYESEGGEHFSPVIVNNKQGVWRGEGKIRVEISFSSQLRLVTEMDSRELINLIQEVSHAASVIR